MSATLPTVYQHPTSINHVVIQARGQVPVLVSGVRVTGWLDRQPYLEQTPGLRRVEARAAELLLSFVGWREEDRALPALGLVMVPLPGRLHAQVKWLGGQPVCVHLADWDAAENLEADLARAGLVLDGRLRCEVTVDDAEQVAPVRLALSPRALAELAVTKLRPEDVARASTGDAAVVRTVAARLHLPEFKFLTEAELADFHRTLAEQCRVS